MHRQTDTLWGQLTADRENTVTFSCVMSDNVGWRQGSRVQFFTQGVCMRVPKSPVELYALRAQVWSQCLVKDDLSLYNNTQMCAHTSLSLEGQCLYLYSRDLQVLLDLVYMYVCPCWPRFVYLCTALSSLSFPFSLLLSSNYFCKSIDVCLTSSS